VQAACAARRAPRPRYPGVRRPLVTLGQTGELRPRRRGRALRPRPQRASAVSVVVG